MATLPAGMRFHRAAAALAIALAILAPWFEEEGVRERFEEHIPLGRIGQPKDVAKLALFLASDESSWITGALIPVTRNT